jgi:MFS family permease
MSAEPTREAEDHGGLLSPALRATTVGMLALVSLHAFEALALTTVMPTIAADLDGESLYAMAFTATLAAGIVSIVWSGNLADRRGPRPPLLLGLVLFAAGLIGAGLAPTMHVLVGARVVQGLGAGMTSTALYVMVTRVYPQRLHTAILAGFSAAWVVPSIAGPFVAGLIAQTIGWRWVFGLAIVVLVAAAALLSRIVAGLRQEPVPVPWRRGAIAASLALAVAVLVLNSVSGAVDVRSVVVAVVALVVVAVTLARSGCVAACRATSRCEPWRSPPSPAARCTCRGCSPSETTCPPASPASR